MGGVVARGKTATERKELYKHDAAYAHALVRAIKEWWDKPDDGQIADGAVTEIEFRAMSLMREWGFDERARS
jgi:hypothetical protein